MLTLLKLVRKFATLLRSDLTPNQIAVGACLGLLMGLTPAGLHWILVLTLALVVNCSLGAFFLAFGVSKLAFLPIAPVAFHLGVELVKVPVAASAITRVVEAPVLAWMDFDRYLVIGAYAIALPVAAIVFLPLRGLVKWYRGSILTRFAEAAWLKLAPVKFVTWIFFGKGQAGEPAKRFLLFRPFRPYVLPVVAVLYVVVLFGAGFIARWTLRGPLERQLTRRLGRPVTIGEVRYRFFDQNLSLSNVQVADRREKKDVVRLGAADMDLSFVDLLAKRVHIEKLSAREIAFHVVRREDGSINVEEEPEDPEDRGDWQEFLRKLREVDWVELYRKWQEYRKKIDLRRAKKQAERKPAYDADLRWEFERRSPLVRVDLVEVRNVKLNVEDRTGRGFPSITSLTADGRDFSSKPGWNGKSSVIAGEGELAGGKSGRIRFRLVLGGQNEFEARLEALPLTDWKSFYESSLPVTVEAGTATLAVRGLVKGSALSAAVNLQIDKLRVAQKAERFMGLDAETSRYAVQGINEYGQRLPVVVGIAVTGTPAEPKIHAEAPFADIARKGLEMAGRRELQKHIDRLAERAKGGIPVALDGEFKKVQENLLKDFPIFDTKSDPKKKIEEWFDPFKK